MDFHICKSLMNASGAFQITRERQRIQKMGLEKLTIPTGERKWNEIPSSHHGQKFLMDSRIQGERWNSQTLNNIKTYVFHKVDKIQEVWDIKEKINKFNCNWRIYVNRRHRKESKRQATNLEKIAVTPKNQYRLRPNKTKQENWQNAWPAFCVRRSTNGKEDVKACSTIIIIREMQFSGPSEGLLWWFSG